MAFIRNNFRYKVLKNFFDEKELKILQLYCDNALNNPSAILSQRNESSFAIAFSNDRLMETMLCLKKELVERETGLDLFKTYTYWRWYGFNSDLKEHTDRPSCEISITACINKTDDWPLTIGGNKLNTKVTKVELNIGDALLYLGTEDLHGRVGRFKGDGLAQVFMHYVDRNGPFTHHADDQYLKTRFNKWSEDDKKYILNLGVEKSW